MSRLSLALLVAIWGAGASLFFVSARAFAYPQYAVRYNIISCTACHISPVGGGPKTINGKLFGAHGYEINPWLVQDYVAGDLRALYYYSQDAATSEGGAGVMAGSIAGHVRLDPGGRIEAVVEQNIAGFAQAPYRDTYALFNFQEQGHHGPIDSLLIGRFRLPFGIVSDEHRTYVRMQDATEWFTFETGALLSGTPTDQIHYDLALVSGENSPGTSLPTGEALRWGYAGNVRWMPGPYLFGVSGSFHDEDPASGSRKALALYTILSLARWTEERVPVDVGIENDTAWGWNSELAQGFANANYVTSVAESESRGWLGWVDWALNERFDLIYKFDYLRPDFNYPADYYQRHGFGFRYVIGPNVIVQGREEIAYASPPTEATGTTWGRQSATYGILQLSF